jgi:hypothetical protein
MMDVISNEYEITLADKERALISELDGETYPEIFSSVIQESLNSLLTRCAQLTRIEVEELKNGHDQPFRDAIRSPVSGLLRAEPHLCRIRDNCVMYKSDLCSLKNIAKNAGAFPRCFEYDALLSSRREKNFAVSLGTCIVQAWRLKRYVIIVKL